MIKSKLLLKEEKKRLLSQIGLVRNNFRSQLKPSEIKKNVNPKALLMLSVASIGIFLVGASLYDKKASLKHKKSLPQRVWKESKSILAKAISQIIMDKLKPNHSSSTD